MDILKIDRSFVAALDKAAGARAPARDELLQAVVGVGRALSLTVVAEGIEEENSPLSRAGSHGLRDGPGVLLGRPSTPEDIKGLLEPRPGRPTGIPEIEVTERRRRTLVP